MKIEHCSTFTVGGGGEIKDIFVPCDDRDIVTQDFIKSYSQEKYIRLDATVTIALCVLDKNESWTNVARELKKEKWFGASLAEWRLYVQDKNNIEFGTVILPGVLYRDDDLIEWVPIVHHRTRIFLKNATEISMKLSTSLATVKARTVLIKKIESQKP